MRKLHRFVLASLAVLASTCFLPTVRADYIIDVSIDTSKLSGDANLTGPFGIDFELSSGSVASGNTATISDFNFGGGSAIAPSSSLGGTAGGNLSGTITLKVDSTTTFFSDLNEGFTPGSKLTFQIDLTTNSAANNPDTLAIYLLQNYSPNSSNLTLVPTTDTSAGTLLTASITPTTPTVVTYGGTSSSDPITTDAVVVPEPGTLVLSLLALGSLAAAGGWTRLRGVKQPA